MKQGNLALTTILKLIDAGWFTIDNSGRIWRCGIIRKEAWVPIPPRRAENVGGKGYLRVSIWIDDRLHSVMAHRLVWEHFNGPIAPGLQINHKDFDKTNNSPQNLEVVSPSDNMKHSYANGRSRIRPWAYCKTWRGKARISSQQIEQAQAMRANGFKLRDIANHLHISTTHAFRISNKA